MSDTQERLFDVTPYGGAEPTKAETPRPTIKVELPVEEWEEGWFTIRCRSGVFPFFHLERARNSMSAVVTMCGIVGTKITNDSVHQMIRCPSCDMAAQLA